MKLFFDGDDYERGLQHGSMLAEAIARRAESSLPTASSDRERVAGPWRAQIHAVAPEVLRELEGVADGSGLPLHDIVLLNSFEAFDLSQQIETGGCTTLAIRTESGAVVAQNWDANRALARDLAVHVHRDPRRGSWAMLASPGSLGWIGMSDRGLAICNNDLLTRATRVGVPSLVLRRLLLASPNVRSATHRLQRVDAVAGRAYTLGDREGSITMIEVAAEESAPSIRNDSPSVHANHAVLAGVMRHEDDASRAAVYPSSPHRFARAQALIASATTAEDLRRILADHDGRPHSICRHHADDEPTETAASVIFDTGKGHAVFILGHPCRSINRVELDL